MNSRPTVHSIEESVTLLGGVKIMRYEQITYDTNKLRMTMKYHF